MIKFYFHPTPNPYKVALFLEEAGLAYEVIPVDTRKGEQHLPAFRAINPNAKLPAIVDTEGAGGPTAVFDSTAILLYLAQKIDRFHGRPQDRGDLLSWLMFVATGVGPYSGQSVHFQRAAPEKLPYAINRYRREVERHYHLLDERLASGRTFFVGDEISIVDMSAWGWLIRASFALGVDEDPLGAFPHLKRWFESVDARPAAVRARAVGSTVSFKQEMDEVALRALYPQNYPATTA
ncbi:MAG: glutathione S-transferase [Azorhizobium sp. 39-67-5]|nr:MAG: glutathione S-transferase [Azorhizobium sp. 39-67-5]